MNEGRPQKNVPKPLGKTSHDVRTIIRLVKVVGMLATNYSSSCPRNKLDIGTGMIPQQEALKTLEGYNAKFV